MKKVTMDKTEKIEFLKQFMESKKLNKSQTGKELKVRESTVRAWLTGRNELPERMIDLMKYKLI